MIRFEGVVKEQMACGYLLFTSVTTSQLPLSPFLLSLVLPQNCQQAQKWTFVSRSTVLIYVCFWIAVVVVVVAGLAFLSRTLFS